MVLLRHNRTAQPLSLRSDARPFGHAFNLVPTLWLAELFRRGYRRQCVSGGAGTLVVFDTNIVHRGSRPAPGRHRDFVLWEAAAA